MSETALILNESMVPPSLTLPEQPPRKPKFSYFSKENAKAMSRLGLEARLKRKAELRTIAQQPDKPMIEDATSYQRTTLLCVREQLKRLAVMMAKETEAQKLDRLASAYAKLSEQERILDGRPLPGSRRPRPEKPTKDTSTVEPVD